MQAKPAIAPLQKPNNDILACRSSSISVANHVIAPIAAAKLLTTTALTALELIAYALPPVKHIHIDKLLICFLKFLHLPLKPVQPNHKRPVPIKTS